MSDASRKRLSEIEMSILRKGWLSTNLSLATRETGLRESVFQLKISLRKRKIQFSIFNKELNLNENHTKLIFGRTVQVTVLMKEKRPRSSDPGFQHYRRETAPKVYFFNHQSLPIVFIRKLFKQNLHSTRFFMKIVFHNFFVSALEMW